MRTLAAVSTLVLTYGCADTGVMPERAGLDIAIAPLTLPGISKVCYDLRVTNSADGAGATVWAKGNPALDGAADAGSLCSTQFGNGSGGGLTFVGACDASPASLGDSGRTNSVTVWVDSLYATGGAQISETGPDGWQDPCKDGCTLNALCEENRDTRIEFNLTILRQANQGFFDIGVNFQDIFCSAKVDCTRDGAPLELLHHPVSGQRRQTAVVALACTSGPSSTPQLLRDPLKIRCGAVETLLDPALGKGLIYGSGAQQIVDPNPADAIWQYAIYAGTEQLQCGATTCGKKYWNIAVGFEPTTRDCVLTSAATALDGTSFSTPTATTYPYVDINVRLTSDTVSPTLQCSTHPLNGAPSGVSTTYTSTSSVKTFGTAFDGTAFSKPMSTQVSSGLLVNLDASQTSSYPGTGNCSPTCYWFDLTANSYHGTLLNGTSYSAAGGGSFVFDGQDNYVSLTRPSQVVNNGSLTLSLWARWTTVGTTTDSIQALVDNNHSWPSVSGFIIQDRPDLGKKLSVAVYPGVGDLTSTSQVGDGTWKQITVTHDGSTTRLYINGLLDGSVSSPGVVVQPAITLGRWQRGSRFLNGNIGAFQVYNRALTSAEVMQNFNASRTRFGL